MHSIFLFFVIFAISLPFNCNIVDAKSKLEMVHVLFRHGDRNPVSHYPTDPYTGKEYWPEGLGQLTKKGKAMEYNLGAWLRKRYPTIVGKIFNTDEVHVISTNFDRTLMSGQCVVAAFYYPDKDIRFMEDIAWMPIPIHSSPDGEDTLLNVDATCPRISSEMDLMKKTPDISAYLKKHQDIFDYVSNATAQTINTVEHIDYIYDTLFIEQNHNLPLPNWTYPYLGRMRRMAEYSFKMMSFTHELKRLRGGPLLKKVTHEMTKKAENSVDKDVNKTLKKLYLYSGHDSTVATLLNTMGVFDIHAPPYAATVLWELHSDDSKNYFVKLFYQNDTMMKKKPIQLTIPGCTSDCPIAKWQSILADVIPENWNDECYRPNFARDQLYIISLSVVSSCLFVTLVILTAMCWRKKGDGLYHAIPTDPEENIITDQWS